MTRRLSQIDSRVIILVLVLVAAVFRFWQIEIKPPHFDEGINGHFVVRMWKDGFYRYDPTNFHGPLYFYILQLSELLFGRGIFAFRFITGLISIGVIVLVAMHRRFIGRKAWIAAGIIALSPGFVFYSRYAIHESLFIFFQVLFSYGFFLWHENRSRLAVLIIVASFFGLFATKETFFVFIGTWLIALLSDLIARKLFPRWRAQLPEAPVIAGPSASWLASPAGRRDWILIGLLGFLLNAAIYTGFFIHPQGAIDMLASLVNWTRTGVAKTGHEKPFLYWLEILRDYEWPVLIGLVVSPLVFFFSQWRERILLLVGFGTWLAYSLIPYKTPWLVLNMHWALAISTACLVSIRKTRWVMIVGLIIALVISTKTMLRLNFQDFTNPREKYVYVQTTLEFKKVADIVQARVKDFPEDRNMRILLLNKDPWPMPWVFTDYPRHAFGVAESVDLQDADVILVDESARKALEDRLPSLGRRYFVLPFQIRDAYQPGRAYLRFDQFMKYVPSDAEVRP